MNNNKFQKQKKISNKLSIKINNKNQKLMNLWLCWKKNKQIIRNFNSFMKK